MNRKNRREKERQDASIEKQYPDFPEYKMYVKQILGQTGKRELKTFAEWRAWKKTNVNLKDVKDER
jgi:hypothetical protein